MEVTSYFLQHINYFAFILCAFIGGITHYLKKFLKKETNVSFTKWFGTANLPATIYTFIVFTFVLIGTIGSGLITTEMNIWAIMYTGFMTGFAIDAGVNSDAKSISKDILVVNQDIKKMKDLGDQLQVEDSEQIASINKQPDDKLYNPNSKKIIKKKE